MLVADDFLCPPSVLSDVAKSEDFRTVLHSPAQREGRDQAAFGRLGDGRAAAQHVLLATTQENLRTIQAIPAPQRQTGQKKVGLSKESDLIDFVQQPVLANLIARQSERIDHGGLFDLARSNETYRYSTTHDLTVFDHADLLQISLEFASRDARGLTTVSSQILGFTTLSDLIPASRLQVSIELELFGSFDAFVFLKRTHSLNSFLTGTYRDMRMRATGNSIRWLRRSGARYSDSG